MTKDRSHAPSRENPQNIRDVLTPWVETSPHRLALVESSGSWTYSQLDEAIRATSLWLRNAGVRAGDRVMIVCENGRSFVATFMALASLDACPVLVNARLSPREIDEIRDHCGARYLIYTTSVSPHAEAHAKRHGAVLEQIPLLGPIGVGPMNREVQPEPVDATMSRRIAAMIYTSGTTGLPKGVMLTHANLLFIATVSAKIRELNPNDRLYGILPMSHAVGLSVVLLGTLLSGATLYLSPRFDPMTARAALEKDGITVMLGVPSMFAQLLDYAKLRGLASLQLPALRIISSSGAPLSAELKAKVENLFGMPLHNGYGVTECSPTIAQANPLSPPPETSVGEVLPGTEIKLVGPDSHPVGIGEIGELRVRGPHVMKGYYRAPEETASAIDADGWFNTRDLARLEGNNLFIVGRTKELIVRFGFNVYPAEVEGVLNSHPDVVRCAVIGRPTQATGGEDVIAFVQLTPASPVTQGDLAKHAAQHLAPYKHPTHIFLVAEMPLTPTGKIAKAELAKTIGFVPQAR